MQSVTYILVGPASEPSMTRTDAIALWWLRSRPCYQRPRRKPPRKLGKDLGVEKD